jgi:hypothetical protein
MAERTITYIKTNTLKNGEIKQYECTKKYKTKTTIKRKMGKEIARKKITACNDKEKIDMLYAYMCEIGM